jgi:predicted dehydrogenase
LTEPRLGIVGCGDILDAYMVGLARVGGQLTVARLADIDLDRAVSGAARHKVAKVGSVEELFADPEIDVVLSLTPPLVHDEVIAAAAETGKHVFTEKPLAASAALARSALDRADRAGILVGSAPDTFLGSAAQTARAAIDAGEIGEVIAVAAFAPYNRAERRHPNPEFLFGPGAGPLLDVAPYHVSWLIHLFGPVEMVAGLSRRSGSSRQVTTPDGRAIEIPVTVDTHVTSLLAFVNGVAGTFITSFDIWSNRLPSIEIYGAAGTMTLPHPNWYDGEVHVRMHDDDDWRVLPPLFPAFQRAPAEKVRGLGIFELADAVRGARHRSSGAFAYHSLEVLEAMQISSNRSEFLSIESRCERPAALTTEDLERWRHGPLVP